MATVLSLMMLSLLALLGGAAWLWRRGDSLRKPMLMLALAVVIAVNIAIWVLPDSAGTTLISGPQPGPT